MNKLIISIGTNSSDRERQMALAIKHLDQILTTIAVSGVYESPAHNGIDAPYLNAVAIASTPHSLEETTSLLKQWERECGRTIASKQNGVIPIDIDIVVWNGVIIRPADYTRDYVITGILQLLERLIS